MCQRYPLSHVFAFKRITPSLRPCLVEVLNRALLVDTYPPPRNLRATHGQHRASLRIAWAGGGVDSVDTIPKNLSSNLHRRVLRDRARGMNPKPKAKL